MKMQLLILWTARGESAAEERAAADSAALSSSGRAAQGGNRPIPPRAAGLLEDVSLCPQTALGRRWLWGGF